MVKGMAVVVIMSLCLSLFTFHVFYMCLHILLSNIVLWHALIDDEHHIIECHCLTCQSHTIAIEQDTGY